MDRIMVAVEYNHLEVLDRYQKLTNCNTEYLTQKAQQWYPEYRSYDAVELEEMIAGGIHFLFRD